MTSIPTEAQARAESPVASAPVLSVFSLVAGAASILFGQTFFLPIAAIIVGFIARRREPHGHTMSTIGIILGFVMLFGWALILLVGASIFVPLAIFHHAF
jgi:hypothetical protein